MERIIGLLLTFGLPYLYLKKEEKNKFINLFGSVALCYLSGVLMSFFFSPYIGKGIIQSTTEATLVLSIPLLLLNTDLKHLWKITPKMVIAFIIAMVTVIISVFTISALFKGKIENLSMLAASVAALFTGGTVNLSSIYMALDIDQNMYITIAASDFLTGAIYFLITLKICSYLKTKTTQTQSVVSDYILFSKKSGFYLFYTVLINIIIVGASMLLFGKLNATFIICGLTTFGVLATQKLKLTEKKKGENLGEYFLMVFCLAVGLQVDLNQFNSESLVIIYFFLSVMGLHALLFFPIAKLTKLPMDQSFIAHIAAIFGPPFVVIISKNMRREDLMAPGIAVGSLGIAVGTFIGLMIFKLV